MQIRYPVVRVLAALALTFVFAFAALAATRAPAKIPFAFEVRGELLPAGEYEVIANTSTNVVYLIGPDGHQRAAMSIPMGNPNAPSKSKIVFEHDGDTYQLTEVWLSGVGGRKVQNGDRKAAPAVKGATLRRIEISAGD